MPFNNARQLVLAVYQELQHEDYLMGSITDICLGMLFDEIADICPDKDVREEDNEAWGEFAVPSQGPAATAAVARYDAREKQRKAEREAMRAHTAKIVAERRK